MAEKKKTTLVKTKSKGTAKKLSPKRKHKAGQPAKLTRKLLDTFIQQVEGWNPMREELQTAEKLIEFQKCSTADCVAHNLGIAKTTFYAYANNKNGLYNEDLSQEFLNTVKRWQTKRNYLHQVMMPDWVAFPTTWIFMYKNFHNIPDINFNQINIDASENITNIQDNSTHISDSTGELTYKEIQDEADRIREEILRRRTRPEVVDTKGRLLPRKQRPD